MTDPTTRPIPQRLPAPNPAPNRPTECPRCGAPAISTRGVAQHSLWHRDEDLRNRKQDRLLDALQEMLAAFDGDPDDDRGERKTFRQWIAETDQILDGLNEGLSELRAALADADARKTTDEPVELLPWPGNPYADDEAADPALTDGHEGEPDDDAAERHNPTADAVALHIADRVDDETPSAAPTAHRVDADLDDDDPHAVTIPGSRF